MNATLNEQDANYILTVIAQRPLAEALPLWLKMTGQQLTPVAIPAPPEPPPPRTGGT